MKDEEGRTWMTEDKGEPLPTLPKPAAPPGQD